MMIRDLGYAGAQRQLVALANGLKAEGHDVTVICFYGGPLQADLEAANVRCPMDAIGHAGLVRKARARLQQAAHLRHAPE